VLTNGVGSCQSYPGIILCGYDRDFSSQTLLSLIAGKATHRVKRRNNIPSEALEEDGVCIPHA
jgi:hypothetical protein